MTNIRSALAAANADLILVILDGSDKHWPEACDKIEKAIDREISKSSTNKNMVGGRLINDRPRLYVLNKADRGIVRANHRIGYNDKHNDTHDMLVISAKKQTDINVISTALVKRLARQPLY